MNYSFIAITKELNNIPAGGLPVTINGRTFKNGIDVELISNQHKFNPQLGLSYEINRLLSLYVKSGYYMAGSQNDDLRFTDKPEGFFRSLFPAHKNVSLNGPGVNLTVDGQPTTKLPYRDNFNVSMGLLGFIRFRK